MPAGAGTRDADLILGQGMVNSGWHAHKLTKPGEFLISDPEHGTPERNRAYLLTDAQRDHHVSGTRRCGPGRPPASRTCPPGCALHGPGTAPGRPGRPARWRWPAPARDGAVGRPGRRRPGGDLGRRSWKPRAAWPAGWVYHRLQAHAKAGRAVQVRRGYWRAARPPGTPQVVTDSDRPRECARASRLRA